MCVCVCVCVCVWIVFLQSSIMDAKLYKQQNGIN